jgi:transposase
MKNFTLTQEQQIMLRLEHKRAKKHSAKREFKVHYSRSGMTKLLYELGFTYKKLKLIPSGLNFQAQEDFLENFETFMKNKHETDVVVFYDSSHPQYQSQSDYGWIKKGEDILLPNHGMRGHVNISGAVDLERWDVIVDFPNKVNAESTVKTLNKIQSYYPQANTINVILDNAAAHRSGFVKHHIGKSKINLVFLPPYSPNLNLMERVWGLLHRKLLVNSFNETYSDFKNRIKYFFNKTLKVKKEKWLVPLITEDFQQFNGHLIS